LGNAAGERRLLNATRKKYIFQTLNSALFGRRFDAAGDGNALIAIARSRCT
jgi:hypothetical protein